MKIWRTKSGNIVSIERRYDIRKDLRGQRDGRTLKKHSQEIHSQRRTIMTFDRRSMTCNAPSDLMDKASFFATRNPANVEMML